MSYRFAYPNGGAASAGGYGVDPGLMSAGYPNAYDDRRQRSYSPESFSSESVSSDDYEYRGRMITRETRHPRDVVRAPTPPPIIKRVVERAPTPEAPIFERVIIRPQAQEIVERVIEQPRTPPPRIIQKEMHEEAPPPIVRTRVIKVDRPLRSGYSQPGSPYGNPFNHGLPSFSNSVLGNGHNYHNQSIVGSAGFQNAFDHNPNFSSASSFEYPQPAPMAQPPPPAPTMMMMPATQPSGVMQQQPVQQQAMYRPVQMPAAMQQQPVQQQVMYRPMQMPASMQQMAPQQMSSPYIHQNYMYSAPHQGMSFGYRPMMQQGRMMPNGIPMMAAGNTLAAPTSSFPSQPPMFNPIPQQLVY